ncbi:MAG: hypothetical protein KDE22_06340, partial [Rhodobacterales bacterium]|nr:hypothetical protein [Rhodobacterales bacterium]
MSDRADKDGPAKPEDEFRRLGPLWQGVLVLGMAIALFLSAYQVFNLGRYTGYVPIENQYYYAVVAVLLPLAYIVFPISGRPGWDRLAWYDVVLFLASFGVFAFLAVSADRIVEEGWEFSAPDTMQWTGLAACLLALEATRRAGGLVVTAIIVLFAIYPLFAGSLPGVLEGSSESLGDTAAFYALSTEALIGIPIRAFAGLVL